MGYYNHKKHAYPKFSTSSDTTGLTKGYKTKRYDYLQRTWRHSNLKNAQSFL
jgi:hypothetical protein